MVNFNNPTKIMVNRCMELLNAKIANARTQHIAKRAAVQRFIPRTVDTKAMYRERQKAKNYEVSKRLSMWEQDNGQAFDTTKNTRLDHLHYKHHKVNERTYHCTWANFPEDHRVRQ
ncbi:uncharacterized protein LOC6564104 [Drosophila grimshawi]|uniref:GH18794 n=1 Tax=Drosophila grimshawi TaxID=7222 RepID=B4JFY0_DROGR|nr:uncharacterized protein LOC6564104 [Drosophila grimshawi]EDV92519.1 GH18794 [Drosophila grimshawi]